MTHHPTPLKFLMPGWFVIVMGLSGLALVWHNANPLLGGLATAVAQGLGWLTAGVALVLAVLSLIRWQRYPQAVHEDLMHPVRHVFVAAMPISLILLATVATALTGPSRLALFIWLLGSVWQFGVTVWALSRWLALTPQAGTPAGTPTAATPLWPSITPALLIPVVGNVLAPLAGVTLGMAPWSAAQMGVGLLLWPVVLTLMVVRVGVAGVWPARLVPTTFITVAPPAVIGLGLLQLGGPPLLAWMAWGMALFFLVWSARVVRLMLAQPFNLTFWALSFPLAAFSALTLRLTPVAPWPFQALALTLLPLVTLLILVLLWATLLGLRRGSLLAPEAAPAPPVAIHTGGAAAA
jgi:tellurite resistance protein